MRPPRMPHTAVPSAPDPAPAGLRERKKAQTRQHISDVATRLFLDRGFDEVTVAAIAGAADVSVKTVFNYFGNKEDLLFDREEEWVGCVAALAASAPSRGLIPLLLEDVQVRYPALPFGEWARFRGEAADGRRRFYRLVHEHESLQARLLVMHERMGASMRTIVADALGIDQSEPEALAAGDLVHVAYTTVGVELRRSMLGGASPPETVRRAVAAGTEALGRLRTAYAGTRLVDGPAAG